MFETMFQFERSVEYVQRQSYVELHHVCLPLRKVALWLVQNTNEVFHKLLLFYLYIHIISAVYLGIPVTKSNCKFCLFSNTLHPNPSCSRTSYELCLFTRVCYMDTWNYITRYHSPPSYLPSKYLGSFNKRV